MAKLTWGVDGYGNRHTLCEDCGAVFWNTPHWEVAHAIDNCVARRPIDNARSQLTKGGKPPQKPQNPK